MEHYGSVCQAQGGESYFRLFDLAGLASRLCYRFPIDMSESDRFYRMKNVIK